MLSSCLILLSVTMCLASERLQPHAALLARELAVTVAPRQVIPTNCYHNADPQNTCEAIADRPGWCLCGNDLTTYAITSASAGPCSYTAAPTPTSFDCGSSTITGGPTIVTGTDAAVTVQLPSALQSQIFSYAQNDTCAAKSKNKRGNCDVGSLGADIISQTGSGGLFNGLIMLPNGAQMPALIPSVAVGVAQVVAAGQQITESAANNPLLQAVAEICLWIAYEKLNNLFSATQPLVIPQSDIANSNEATASTPQCPDITAAPNCEDCGGNNGKSLCVGNANGYTSCLCYDPPDLKWAPFNAADLAAMPASFDAMMTNPSPTPTSTSSTTTSISTTTALATPTPVLTCQDYNTYFDPSSCGWRDIQAGYVEDAVDQFYVQLPNGPMTPTAPNITQFWQGGGVNYIFNVGWLPDCAGPSQNLPNPLAWNQSLTYQDLLRGTYYDCINNGVGGWYDVGCLRYRFWPFTFNIGKNPANYPLFWAKMSYCGN